MNNFKRIIIYSMVATLGFFAIGLNDSLEAVVGKENITTEQDGDVCENPWGHLFEKETDSKGNIIEKPGTTTNNNGNSNANKTLKLARTKIKSATKAKKISKKAKIVLKKVKKARGYQIKICKNRKFKKKNTRTINTKKTKVVIRKLKARTKYYVKARAYSKGKTKKNYGSWSKIKKVKIVKK